MLFADRILSFVVFAERGGILVVCKKVVLLGLLGFLSE
jgi:hypothetical protein